MKKVNRQQLNLQSTKYWVRCYESCPKGPKQDVFASCCHGFQSHSFVRDVLQNPPCITVTHVQNGLIKLFCSKSLIKCQHKHKMFSSYIKLNKPAPADIQPPLYKDSSPVTWASSPMWLHVFKVCAWQSRGHMCMYSPAYSGSWEKISSVEYGTSKPNSQLTHRTRGNGATTLKHTRQTLN